jgi:hypothetical protein
MVVLGFWGAARRGAVERCAGVVCAVWRAIGGAGEEGGAGKWLRAWAFPRVRVPRAGRGSVGSGVGDTMRYEGVFTV